MLEVIVENVSQHPQVGWAVAGMPKPLTDAVGHLRSKNDDGTFAIARGQELFIATNLQGHERRRITLVAAEDDVPPFQFHHWAVDKPEDLLLAFAVNVDGTEHRARAVVRLESANEARVRFHFTARVHDINIEGWLSMFSAQPWAEFEIRATYGTTATQGLHRVYGSLRMYSGEPMHVDWGVRKGLEPCFELKDGTWETEIAKPGQWMRARTVEVFGAMLFEPDIDAAYEEHVARRDWGPEETASDSFVTPHLADERAGGPICAMLAAHHWADHWSPTGAMPKAGPWADTEQRRRLFSLWARLRLPADEYETRPYAQPPNSGQTGEQPDFGCSRGEAVIAMEEPWAIYDLRYSVQAWLLRPYANREPNGAPVQAKDHPEAALYNLRPDERFGSDMLGWPKPVGWISGYTTSDSQHRSDNLLWAMWRLTRSPSLERTIRDIIELEKMALKQPSPPRGSGVGAPRGWGRPLLSWAHGLQCGFEEFEPLIVSMVSRMAWAADYTARPYPTAQQVLSSREGKYGWNNADGTPIRGVTWWQEAIAVIGLYAAWRVTGMPSAREMALVVAKSICRHAFFEREPGTFDHCYVTRWLDGAALTREQYLDPLFAVREGAASYWTAAALRVLLALEPECADAPRARAILAGYVPNNWDKACWAAIA